MSVISPNWREIKLKIQGTRHQWLTIVRYVDDVFVITRWFCPKCVAFIIARIYPRTISFDPANDGAGKVRGYNVVRFLDLWCYFNWSNYFFSLVYKNDLYVFPGLSLYAQKQIPYPSRR